MKKFIFTLICIANTCFSQEGNTVCENLLNMRISEVENILIRIENEDKENELYTYFLGRLDSYNDIHWNLNRAEEWFEEDQYNSTHNAYK